MWRRSSGLWELLVGLGTLFVMTAIVLTIWACFDEDNSPVWRWTFPLLAAGVGCCCSPMFVVGLLCLVAAVLQDLLCGRQRDLAHWIGVATAFAVVFALHRHDRGQPLKAAGVSR
jgi:hypothetical protein